MTVKDRIVKYTLRTPVLSEQKKLDHAVLYVLPAIPAIKPRQNSEAVATFICHDRFNLAINGSEDIAIRKSPVQ